MKRSWAGLLFVLPALLLFSAFILLPALGSVGLSFCRWDGWGQPVFVGLSNYHRALVSDDIFRAAFGHNLIYMGATLVLEVGAGLVLGLLLDVVPRARGLFRVLLFMPMMLSLTVIGMMWRFICHPTTGLLPNVLGDERTALWTICVVSGWTYCGFYMVLFQAGLQRIPPSLYDAARIDGCGELRRILHVSIPLLRNTLWVSALLCVTGAFRAYDLFWVMTQGGPLHATEVVSTHLVQTAFTHHQMGYGSALAVLMSLVVLATSLGYAWVGRRRAGEEF